MFFANKMIMAAKVANTHAHMVGKTHMVGKHTPASIGAYLRAGTVPLFYSFA